MQQRSRTVWIGVAILIALAAGFGFAKVLDHQPASDRSPAEKAEKAEGGDHDVLKAGDFVKLTPDQTQAAGIAIVTVVDGGATDMRLSGRIEPAPEARAVVGSPVAGSVQQVLVSPGKPVNAGAPLVLVRSAAGASFHADVVSAEAEAQAAQLAAARDEHLLKDGVIARQDWEASSAAAAKASAAATAARARAAASGAPADNGLATVRAPIRGIVTSVAVAPGGFVAEGATVADISDPARVEAVFTAPPRAASKLKAGDHLALIGQDGSETPAVIIGVAPMAALETGASVVRARPTSPGLIPGQPVSASVTSGGLHLPTVPSEAVQTVGGKSVVFVVDDDGFRAKPVTPGISGGGSTQIVQGLEIGERVAGRGAFVLKAELSKGEAKDND